MSHKKALVAVRNYNTFRQGYRSGKGVSVYGNTARGKLPKEAAVVLVDGAHAVYWKPDANDKPDRRSGRIWNGNDSTDYAMNDLPPDGSDKLGGPHIRRPWMIRKKAVQQDPFGNCFAVASTVQLLDWKDKLGKAQHMMETDAHPKSRLLK